MMKGVGQRHHWWNIAPAQADEGYVQQLPQQAPQHTLSTFSTTTTTTVVKQQQESGHEGVVEDEGQGGGRGGLCLLSSRRVFLGDFLISSPSLLSSPLLFFLFLSTPSIA